MNFRVCRDHHKYLIINFLLEKTHNYYRIFIDDIKSYDDNDNDGLVTLYLMVKINILYHENHHHNYIF